MLSFILRDLFYFNQDVQDRSLLVILKLYCVRDLAWSSLHWAISGESYRKKKSRIPDKSNLCLKQCFSAKSERERERKEYISIGDNGKRTNLQSSGPLSETHKTAEWTGDPWSLLTQQKLFCSLELSRKLHWGGVCAKAFSCLDVPNMTEHNQIQQSSQKPVSGRAIQSKPCPCRA